MGIRPDRIVVVTPARNCGGSIGRLTEEIRGFVPELVVIDDGSSDNTGEEASTHGASVLRLDPGRGKGAAMRTGIAEILAESKYEWVIFMDGDGQHLPSDIPNFLENMNDQASMLLGDRLAESEKFPNHRLITNRVGSLILRLMTAHAIPDTQCGFRAFRTNLLREIKLESDGFEIETEMLLKSLAVGARWKSIPVETVYEGVKSNYRAVSDTYKISMAALRYARG